jgi:hypothetical protein
MKKTIHFGIAAAAALAFGLALQQPALAQHDHGGGGMSTPSPSLPTVRTGKVKGTLVSRDETSIKVEAKQSKQTGTVTYMVDRKTKFKGDVQPGSEVTVKYEEQAGMQKATTVEAKKTKEKHSH